MGKNQLTGDRRTMDSNTPGSLRRVKARGGVVGREEGLNRRSSNNKDIKANSIGH